MIKEWGFVLKPLGGIGAASRSDILIGYPFAFTVIPVGTSAVPLYIDPNLLYYRKYLADVRQVVELPAPRNTAPMVLSPDLNYFRNYLGERT